MAASRTRLIQSPGGKLILLKPPDIVGPPIWSKTRYDVKVFGKVIGVVLEQLGRDGSRDVVALELESDLDVTPAAARHVFGFDIDEEAKSLGLKPDAEVDVQGLFTGHSIWALRVTIPE